MLVVCVTIYRETSRFNVRKVQSRDTSSTNTTTTTPLTSTASTPRGSCQEFKIGGIRSYRNINAAQRQRDGFSLLSGHRRMKEKRRTKTSIPEINILSDADDDFGEATGAREAQNPTKNHARKCISDPTSLAKKRRNGSRNLKSRSRDTCSAISSTLTVPKSNRPSSLVYRRKRQQSSLRGSIRSSKPRSLSMGSLSRTHLALVERGPRLPMLGSATLSHRMATLNRDRKALRTLGVIIGSFLLFWTPYHVMVIWLGICSPCVNSRLYAFSYYLCYLNSTFNPWVYAFCNKTFKETYIRILSCRRKKYFDQPESRCSFRMIDEDNSQF
ncbi:muscarinic acetylcholine receptor M5-like [Ptychodera flava]|uniref:muscarinic acetylcholine receptor M5-like n=1 Tax=Ptychodera flava TaxID=63121 RepID=UPI003969F968